MPGVVNWVAGRPRPPSRKLWHIADSKCQWRCWLWEKTTTCLWREASTLRQRQQNSAFNCTWLICSLYVTNNKRLYSTFCTVEANYWHTRSIARPLCDSRATCLHHWGSLFNFLYHWGIGDVPTFVSISLFSQFSAHLKQTWRNEWRRQVHFGTDIRRTSGSRLIRKSKFESRMPFGSNFGVGGGLQSLLQTEHQEHLQLARYRTSDHHHHHHHLICSKIE